MNDTATSVESLSPRNSLSLREAKSLTPVSMKIQRA